MADPIRRDVGSELDRMNASLHMHRYRTPRETLGWIALNAERTSTQPTAIYREPLTMDDYLSARMITTPFGLYDCDVPCDGATAFVVSAVDAAHDLAKPPVFVEAVGTQITEPVSWDQGTLEHEPMLAGPARTSGAVRTAPGRCRRRAPVRRLHVQLPLVDRSAWVLRYR